MCFCPINVIVGLTRKPFKTIDKISIDGQRIMAFLVLEFQYGVVMWILACLFLEIHHCLDCVFE